MTHLHTPGPWSVTQEWGSLQFSKSYGVQAPTQEGPGFPTPSATGYYAMALPPPHGHDPKSRAIQEANARLIAAAPDLLAAVERAEMWLGKMIADGGHKNAVMPNDCVRTAQMVRAAIAKATQP